MSVYDYYPLVLKALELISQGQVVTRSCDQAGIALATFEAYIARDPELQQLRAEAERRGHDALADALINIDNHRIHGHSDPKMAKVVSDNIKWFLSKKDQKRFGDKVEVSHTLTADRAIVDALNAARTRVAQIASPVIEDAIFEVVNEDDEIAALLR